MQFPNSVLRYPKFLLPFFYTPYDTHLQSKFFWLNRHKIYTLVLEIEKNAKFNNVRLRNYPVLLYDFFHPQNF